MLVNSVLRQGQFNFNTPNILTLSVHSGVFVCLYLCGELPFWQVIFFFCLTESCLFVVYSFHSPQVVLEFCGFMQLSAVSFFSEFSRVLWSAVFSFPASSGLLYFSWEFFSLYLFILEGSDSLVSISGFEPSARLRTSPR